MKEGRCAGGRTEKRAQPINSAEDDDDDDFIAFEGPTLNLAPPREIEPGRFTIIMSCSLQRRGSSGGENQAPTQFLLRPPRPTGAETAADFWARLPLTLLQTRWESMASLLRPRLPVRSHQNAECSRATGDFLRRKHTPRGREGGRTGEKEEEGERLAAHPRHDRRFVTLLL